MLNRKRQKTVIFATADKLTTIKKDKEKLFEESINEVNYRCRINVKYGVILVKK